MAEESYPVVEQPVSAAQWSTMAQAGGDGIIDRGNWPFWPGVVSSANNTVTIKPSRYKSKSGPASGTQAGEAVLSGFYYRMTTDMVLTIPAVTTDTTYWVALQYDPLRGSSAGGPIKLGVFKGALDRTQGKTYLVLWSVTRKNNQTLQDAWGAASQQYRPRVSPQLTVSAVDHLPTETETLVDTCAFVRDTGTTWRADPDGVGGIKWARSENTRILDFQFMGGWDLTGSPTGGIVFQHTREGRTFCTAEVMMTRVVAAFPLGTSWKELATIIPAGARSVGVNNPVNRIIRVGTFPDLTEVSVHPETGKVFARQLTRTRDIVTRDSLRFDISWVR